MGGLSQGGKNLYFHSSAIILNHAAHRGVYIVIFLLAESFSVSKGMDYESMCGRTSEEVLDRSFGLFVMCSHTTKRICCIQKLCRTL